MIERRSLAARASDSSATCAPQRLRPAPRRARRRGSGSATARSGDAPRTPRAPPPRSGSIRTRRDCGRRSTMPSCARRAIACRILVRLTPKIGASFSSTSWVPGGSRCSWIALRIRSWISPPTSGFGCAPRGARTSTGRSAPATRSGGSWRHLRSSFRHRFGALQGISGPERRCTDCTQSIQPKVRVKSLNEANY